MKSADSRPNGSTVKTASADVTASVVMKNLQWSHWPPKLRAWNEGQTLHAHKKRNPEADEGDSRALHRAQT